jgi:hypothetical protein
MMFADYPMDRLRNSSLMAVRAPRGQTTAEAIAQPMVVFAFKILGTNLSGDEFNRTAVATGWLGGRLTAAATPRGDAAYNMYLLCQAVTYHYPRGGDKPKADDMVCMAQRAASSPQALLELANKLFVDAGGDVQRGGPGSQ